MNKFIRSIISFSLKNRFFTFFVVGLLIVSGIYSYVTIPLEAFPDVNKHTNNYCYRWDGEAPKNGALRNDAYRSIDDPCSEDHVRSITMFGLSVIKSSWTSELVDLR